MAWYDPRTWGKKEEAPKTGEGSMIFKESEKSSAQQAIDSGKSVTIVAPTGKTETYSGGTKTSTGTVSSGTKKTSITKVVEEEKLPERSPLAKSQAKTTAQTSVGAGKPLSEYAGTQRTSYWEATKGTARNIGLSIAGGFGFGEKKGAGIEKWKGTFDPFKTTGKEKSEKVARYDIDIAYPQKRTVSEYTISPSGELIPSRGITPVTYMEIQKDIESKESAESQRLEIQYKKEIEEAKPQFQQRIDAGEDYHKVSEEYKEFAEQRASELGEEFLSFKKFHPDVTGFTTRTGEKTAKVIPAVIETGALIGASTLGGPVGMGLSSTYIASKGTEQFFMGETKFDKAMGLATIGLGVAGLDASFKAMDKSILAGELGELSGKPIQFEQVLAKSGEDELAVFTAKQEQMGLTRTFKGSGRVISEDGLKVIPSGPLEITTTGKFSWSPTGSDAVKIYSQQFGEVGSKTSFKVAEDLTFSLGKSTFAPSYDVTTMEFIKGKTSKMTTTFLTPDTATSSLGFASTRKAGENIFGEQQFFTTGFGVEDGKLTRPFQFGRTTVKEIPETAESFSLNKLPKIKWSTKSVPTEKAIETLGDATTSSFKSFGRGTAGLSPSSDMFKSLGGVFGSSGTAPQITLTATESSPLVSLRGLTPTLTAQIKTAIDPTFATLQHLPRTAQVLRTEPRTKTKTDVLQLSAIQVPELQEKSLFAPMQTQTKIRTYSAPTLKPLPSPTKLDPILDIKPIATPKPLPPLRGGLGLPYSPPFPPVGIPSMMNLFDYGRKGAKKSKTHKGKYAPSLASIGLGITAPKVPSLYSKGAGSLIMRPIISTKLTGGKKSGKRKRSSKGARKSNRRKRN